MSTILRVRSTAITVSVRVPWRAGIGLERRQVDDRHLRHEAFERLALGPDQQVADEQRVPGIFGDDAGRQGVGLVGAADQVLDEEFLAFGMRQEVGMSRRSKWAPASSACCCPTRHAPRWTRRARRTCPSASGRCAGRYRRPARQLRSTSPRDGPAPPRRAPLPRDCSGPCPHVVDAGGSMPQARDCVCRFRSLMLLDQPSPLFLRKAAAVIVRRTGAMARQKQKSQAISNH